MLQRTQLREYDMMNLDMRYNPVDRILPSRCALTGASRSGRACARQSWSNRNNSSN